MTTTRYPGNPDFHEIPPRCAGCGQFVGEIQVWEENENFDLPNTHTCRCVGCATERAMERGDFDTREEARHAVLGAISG